VFKLSTYVAALDQSKGSVPEFVNPKYADADKTKFKSPTRLECMMQDLPRMFTHGEKLGFTSLNRPAVRQYSPVKNNVKDAVGKQASGLEPACASAGEFDVYRFNCDHLNAGGKGMTISSAVPAEFSGIKVAIPPAAILSPDFLLNCKSKVVGGSLSARSTLILEGRDITLKNVHVDGCLIVRAAKGAKVKLENISIKNSGWEFVALSEEEELTVPEEIKIRGFKVVKHSSVCYEHPEAGEFLHDGSSGEEGVAQV